VVIIKMSETSGRLLPQANTAYRNSKDTSLSAHTKKDAKMKAGS